MKKKNTKNNQKNRPLFIITLISFLIIILLSIYIIYLRFIPYTTIEYNGYAVSGKEIASNLLNTNFDVDHNIKALEVKDQDAIYEKLNSYYLGASKQDNINLNYPIYVNNSLALYNLSPKVTLITDDFQEIQGYSGTTLTSGELYNSNTLQRADYYDYILLKNTDNLYINTKEIKIKTTLNEYTIKMNSIINFTREFITYYTLKNDEFVYDKILDIDENSTVTIEDYNKKYTYKEFLMNLGIIREEKNETQEENNNTTKEEPKEEKNETQEQNSTLPETKEEPKKEEIKIDEEPKEEKEEENGNIDIEKIWIKPTVTCTDFTSNVYTAFANLSISDPSRVIYKAITFTFYKDNEIAFRVSSANEGEISVTKLLPSTTYKIVGTYQYRNREGNLIENTVLEQDITTKGVGTLNQIELEKENGQIYSNKIEIKNLRVTSDLTDEAIYGVSKAEVLVNGTKYAIDTNTLRKILKGEGTTYQTTEGLKSDSTCDYEIRFYDTAGNIMNLKNNTGSTVTSKKAPSVKVKVSAQEVISVGVELTIVNEDNVEISNYRYVLYSENGEEIASSTITNGKTITFDNLNPQKTYTIKIYADFDISDGTGKKYNQEIGNSTFTTLPLSKLGSLKMEVSYDIDTDLTCNSINLTTAINMSKTDNRLVKILKSVKLSIQDEKNTEIKSFEMEDIASLSAEAGIKNLIEGLNSNTTYNVVITAKAMQGDTEEDIQVSYTLKKFLTNKLPAKINITNVVVTTEVIDMDVYIEDIDKSCLEDIVNIRLLDSYDKEYLPDIEPKTIKSSTKIPTNQWVRLTYDGLKENETYTLSAEVASYNETNDVSKVQNNFVIEKTQFVTTGLGGKIDLVGLERQMQAGRSNLVDVKSENNWYSKCFDALTTNYQLYDTNNANFVISSKYNYGKTYTEDDNSITLTLLSNQCYVYDLSKYAGQTVTMSFSAKVTEADAKVYIQQGKAIGKNIEQITGLGTGELKTYTKTLKVPDDGYVGFYLEKYEETIPPPEDDENAEPTKKEKDYNLTVKNLKIELGENATEYTKYGYDFFANMDVEFIDENHITYDKDEQRCKYYVRLKSYKDTKKENLEKQEEYDYTYNSTETIKENHQYKIEETLDTIYYTAELIIKQYGREYVLDKVDFTYNPETCTEIKSISTVEEFKNIQPYGNYILLNDIELTGANTPSEFTFGNPNIPFYGSIDFNGKTVKKDTYSLGKNRETTSYMFYKIDKRASLKNIVIDYYMNNALNRYTTNVDGTDAFIADEDGTYSLFLYNEGNIDNIMVNLKSCTQKQRIKVGLVGYKNSGTIENFIINTENTLYGSQYLAGVCLYSDGIIQNGYLYGNGIEGFGEITIGDYRYISGVVFQVEGEGILQNIYNISQIKMNHCDATYSYAANIAYNIGYPPIINEGTGAVTPAKTSTAIVRNVYSVQSIISVYNDYEYYGIMDSSNKEGSLGPNILNTYTETKVKESYYFCDVSYDANDNNTKSSATALYEPGVQDVMLNANTYRQFIIDTYVNNGYYPHLLLNDCMPKQENIKIDVTGTEIIDVLSGEIIENNDISKVEMTDKVKSEIELYLKNNKVDLTADNLYLAVFRVYNPAGTTISEINVNYIDTAIMSQSYSKKVSTVYCVLNNPTSYLDTYEVASIRSKMANGKIKESIYGENEDLGTRTIEVTFIKNISTAEEWNSINNDDKNGVSGLIQNYRLVSDIDFANADYSPYITGTFQGYLDGKYKGEDHTLKNINGTTSLIKGFSKGTIKNINVEGLTIEASTQKIGFIEYADITENIIIDNIHIKDMEITSNYSGGAPYIGGIIGGISSGSKSLADSVKVQNCSVQNLTVEFTNKNVTSINIGGIVGYLYIYGGVEAHVSNSFVQNLLFNANDVTSNSGVGGIVGYKGHDADARVKEGTPYVYIENCYSIGKINTYNQAGGILGYGRYGNTYVNNCYSMVNITSRITSGNAYIGGIIGYGNTEADKVKQNFYIGNIYVAGNNVKSVNRIYGSNAGTASYQNYAYKDQLINGEITTNTLGATKLLSYEEAFQLSTYTNLLKWGKNYTYEIIKDDSNYNLLANQYLPQLNDTEGKILSSQKLVPIDNDLKLDSITSTPSSDKTKVTVVMKFENRNNLNLTRVKIENNDMQVIEGTWKTSKDSNGLTVVTFDATPNRAYDSYKIESIYYERDGQEIEKEITTKIKVELYKGISNAKEWNEFFSGEGRSSEGQNVKVTGNIDFSTVNAIEKNVVIGKLEADSMLKITNATISSIGSYSGLIKEIKTSLKNITFENINISGQASYSGIISTLRGNANNCKFNNINISINGDYIGIVSRNIAGNFNSINLSNIVVSGKSYIGALCGQASSLGSSANIEGTYINVTGTGSNIGGILGYTDGNISNISTYQYSKDGKKTGDKDTNYLVKGGQYVGGNIGRYGGGGSTVRTLTTTNSTIKGSIFVASNIGYGSGNANTLTATNNTIEGSGNYVGGNVGYHGWTYSNMTSTNNTITGNNYIGGNEGGSGWASVYTAKSENNKIKGSNYVGGCSGVSDHYYGYLDGLRSQGTNQEIIGESHVGGAVGRSTGRIRNTQVQQCTVTGSGNYVGGVVGSSEYSTTSVSTTNSSQYAITGANAKNVTVTGTMNYVGGIVGYQVGTMSGGVLENTTVVSSQGNNVGGIAGFYTGYTGKSASSIASSNFYLSHSYAVNSTIQGKSNVGGIAGNFVYGNVQYCYVGNSSITAENNSAGGIVGYFDNSKLSNIQYKATIKYNFIANTEDDKTVVAGNSAGGLIGTVAKKLNYDEDIQKYNNLECNLITTDVQSPGIYIDIAIGSVGLAERGVVQSDYMNNIYVYDCSTLNGTQVGGISEETLSYTMVSSTELSTNIYTKNEKITETEIDEEGNKTEKVVGNKGLNFGTARYDYSNGYFPTLKANYSANVYWSNLGIVQSKIPIPKRTASFTANTISLDDITASTANLSLLQAEELPDVFIYTVDIDKINIEFRNINKNTKFKITSEQETIIGPTDIKEQVYTLKYDFETPLDLTVYNSNYSYKKQIEPGNVNNLLSIVGDEYFYLSKNSVTSNKRTLDGNYINLFKDKLLDQEGNIYDILSMSKISNTGKEIKLQETETPITEAKTEDKTIKTFAHCSQIIQANGEKTYKEQQIFVKNGYMYVVDGKMNNKNGTVIIDTFNNKQYETVLGEDGVMYDLLTQIKYPSNFKNNNIVAMTNNVEDNNNVVLVYYANGKVYGFNYVTGEEVYDNNEKDETLSLSNYILENLSGSVLLYNINKSDYVVATELASKLDKVSIDEAIQKINKNNKNGEENIEINLENENNEEGKQNTGAKNQNNVLSTVDAEKVNNKYVTTYDAEAKSYVVYSTAELTKTDTSKVQSENEKINENQDLISYYTNLSTSKSKLKDTGIVIIGIIVASICVILVILYRKTNK